MKKYFLFAMPVVIITLVAFSLKKSSHGKTAYSKEKIAECVPTNNLWQIAPQFQPAAPSAILLRKDFRTLSKYQVLNINYAVAKMKGLPATNPLSWNFQVAIHNTPYPSDPSTPGVPSTSETCQHGNCFFLAWHRMYLFFFERILFKHMRNDWAKPPGLPYWNNANTFASTSSNTIIPAIFRYSFTSSLYAPPPPSAPSSLLHVRNINYNRTGLSVWPMPTAIGIDYDNALNNTNYYDFQTALENAHGLVHTTIGSWINPVNGTATVYDMFDGAKAANDPIFFFHHVNVDRYWEKWLAKGGRRKNPGAGCDAFWWNKTFEFYDSTGLKVSMKGKDIIETDRSRMLNYKYDNVISTPFSDTTCKCENQLTKCPKPSAIIIIQTPDTRIYGPMGKITFSVTAEEVLQKLEELDKIGLKNQYDVFAEFSNITYKNPPTGIEVYVNPGSTEPAELTSERNDYAASIDLFTPKAVSKHGEMHAMEKGGHNYTQRIKITHILKQKNISLSNSSKIELVLLLRGGSTPNGWLKGGDLTIGKAAIAVYPKR